jgi:hypothetical protein
LSVALCINDAIKATLRRRGGWLLHVGLAAVAFGVWIGGEESDFFDGEA